MPARCGAAGAGVASRSTSSMRTTPSGPLPATLAGSMPSSCARRRAAGEMRGRSGAAVAVGGVPSFDTETCAAGAAEPGSGGVCGMVTASAAAALDVAGPDSLAIRASTAPTGTVAPGCTTSSSRTPSSKTSTSMSPLLVSTTASASPRRMRSPGFFSHCVSVPLSMSAPSAGIRKSMRINRSALVPRTRCAQDSAARLPRGAAGRGAALRRVHTRARGASRS